MKEESSYLVKDPPQVSDYYTDAIRQFYENF